MSDVMSDEKTFCKSNVTKWRLCSNYIYLCLSITNETVQMGVELTWLEMYKALFCLKNYKHNDGAKFDIIYGKYQDV
jgi:hypothetical protein